MSTEKFDAEESRYILNSPVFKKAKERLSEYIDRNALACNPDNKEQAQRIILSKQLLAGIVRELEAVIQEGEIHEIKIHEMQTKKRIFSRY